MAHASGQEDATHSSDDKTVIEPKSNEIITFKDAVGRRFLFPFDSVRTWHAMNARIVNAFEHVDFLAPLVRKGYYDLIAPEGEIISAQVWESVIKPGWTVRMTMWPFDFEPPPKPAPKPKRDPLDNEKGVQMRSFKLAPHTVICFPGDRQDQDLALVLFFVVFNPHTIGAELDLSCKVSLESVEGKTASEVAKAAFFRPCSSGVFHEPLERQLMDGGANGGSPKFEASTTIFVQSTTPYILAALVRCPGPASPVSLSAIFEAKSSDDSEGWIYSAPSITALVSSNPSRRPRAWTPFSWALRNGWQDALPLLLQQPEVLQNRRDNSGRSTLSWATSTGHELATGVLMAGSETDPNEQDGTGRTPLSWAAGEGQTRTMQMLLGLDKGKRAGFGLSDESPSRPPLQAAGPSQDEAMKSEVSLNPGRSKRPVDPNIPDNDGRTPLSWAAGNGHAEAVLLLLRHEKQNMTKTGVGELAREMAADDLLFTSSPSYMAARNGHENVFRILLEQRLGRLPVSVLSAYVHKAAEMGWPAIIKLLIEKGSSVDERNPENEDYTPLCVAAQAGSVEVVELLLQQDANRNHKVTKTGDTPLTLAVSRGREAVVKVLLEAGADITLANAKGETPKSLAQRVGHANIFNMIAAVDKEGSLAETVEAPHFVPSVDGQFHATVLHFTPGSGTIESTAEEVDVASLLKDPILGPSGARVIRWLHLPANNMRWVEVLMMTLCGSKASAYKVLDPERWVKRQHHGATGVHHARFMRPHCQDFPSASLALDTASKSPQKGKGRYRNNLVLFMPFLHWDLEELKSKRDTVVRTAVTGNRDALEKNQCLNSEQKLLQAYLNNKHPLHLRRTLDQYYYHTLADTQNRDNDQVITRYQSFTELRPRIITMVDQLWLWVLSAEPGSGLPDTIVTCFPHVGHGNNQDVEDASRDMSYPDPDALTSVLQRLKLSLLDSSFYIQTAHDLAGLIAATCSRVYLDPGSTLSFQKGRFQLQFAELYETEISNIAQGEAVLFNNFANLMKGDVADISEDIQLLSRIKDVLDELNIMRVLFGEQRKILKTMDGIVKSADQFEEEESDNDGASWSTFNDVEGLLEDAQPDDADLNPEFNGPGDRDPEFDDSRALDRRRMRHIWGSRSDADEFSYPLAMVTTSLEEIGAMIERAGKTEQALILIMDLKQKHNSVTDAQESLKQGRIVLIFTLTTIIFLPLSFLTSFFTIEISQFRRNSDGQLDLGYVSYILFPVSSVVSALLIWVAFNVDSARAVWKWLKRLFQHGSDPRTTLRGKEEGKRLAWELAEKRVSSANEGSDLEAQKDKPKP